MASAAAQQAEQDRVAQLERELATMQKMAGITPESLAEAAELEERKKRHKIETEMREANRKEAAIREREKNTRVSAELLKNGTLRVHIGNNWERVDSFLPGTTSVACPGCGKPVPIPCENYSYLHWACNGDKEAMFATLTDSRRDTMNVAVGQPIFEYSNRCSCGTVTRIVIQYVL